MSAPTPPLLVLDTNILSYLYRQHPLAERYLPHLQGHAAVVAFQTVAELRYGMEKAGWGERRRAEMEAFMARFRTLYPTDGMCTLWAGAVAGARRAGQPIDASDAWVAATALALRCPLVTHNEADFAGVPGLKVITEQD